MSDRADPAVADPVVGGTVIVETGARPPGLVGCLCFAAMTGAVVAGLGSPIVLEVATDRQVSIAAAQWTLLITLVVGIVVTPVLSRWSDGRLRRRVLLAALVTVAVGCAVGAAVPTFAGLLSGRALQGLGYAMVPITVSIARKHLRGRTLTRTLGVLSTSVAIGVGVGNPVMGVCVQIGGYRVAFLFAFLVTAAAGLWAWRRVPVEPAAGSASVELDVPGALLLGVGLSALVLAVSRGENWGWASGVVLILEAVAVIGLTAWVLVELRVRQPLVDLRLACSRGLLGVNLSAILLGVTIFGGVAVVLLLAQRTSQNGVGFGYSVFQTGLLMLPMAVASLFSPQLARWLGTRMPPRLILPLGSLLVAASFGMFDLAHDRTWHIALMMGVMGVGIGIAYSVMPAIIVELTPPERTASATGVNQVLRLVGGCVGAAVMTAQLSAHIPAGATSPVERGYLAAMELATVSGLVAVLVGYLLVPASGRRPAGTVDKL